MASRAFRGEVQDRRRELTGIDQGRRGIVRQHRFDFDLFAEGRFQQTRCFDDHGVDVNAARLQRLAAGEGQQMPGEIGAPRCCGAHHVGDVGELRTVPDRLAKDFDGSGDYREYVVEVVGDATVS
jgi:hypothetical protein